MAATFLFFADPITSQQWQVGVQDDGRITTLATSSQTLTPTTLSDYLQTNSLWKLGAASGIQSVAIVAGGTGYVVGDILTVLQGSATGGKLQVTAVAAGAVTALAILDAGSGYAVGSPLTTTGGTGTGCTVNVSAIAGRVTTSQVFGASSLPFVQLLSTGNFPYLIQVDSIGRLYTTLTLLNRLPKIIYPSSVLAPAGSTLFFARPPRKVAAYNQNPIRHDTLALAGVRQTIFIRRDDFLEFEMEWVAIGADITSWSAFMAYALQGGPFDYYPDATINSFTTYLHEKGPWKAAYKVVGQYTFGMKFRVYVSP